MIRGNKRPVPAKANRAMQLDLRASIHNRFDVEVRDAATGELRQKAVGYNVICNALWDRIFNSASNGDWYPQDYFSYVLYGSGSGTPDAADTTLFSQLGAISVSNPALTQDRENSIAWTQAVAVLQAEDAVGSTLTEVGIGYDQTHCVTHALLEDMNGNPISITKTATDVIKIYATVYIHWPAAAWYGGSINVAGVNEGTAYYLGQYTLLRKLCGYCGSPSYHTFLMLWNVLRSAPTFESDSNREFTITLNKAQKKITASIRIAATEQNIPIRFFTIGFQLKNNNSVGPNSTAFLVNLGSWYTPPAISGEAIGTGDGTTKDFITAFPVKSGATVKVNGSVASGATVRTGAPDGTKLHEWINPVAGFTSANVPFYPNAITRLNMSRSESALKFDINVGDERVLDNPFFSAGIASFSVRDDTGTTQKQRAITLYASDDGSTWAEVGTASWAAGASHSNKTINVSSALQNKRYFKLALSGEATEAYSCYLAASVPGENPETNVHFDTAPAAGAVITCDYTPDCIAKDANHVFDLTVELTLGEYQE